MPGTLIARDLGVSRSFVYSWLSRLDVQCRAMPDAVRRTKLDESYFSQAHSGSSYWAGFLLADGCVLGNMIIVALKGDDLEHIRAWQSAISSEHKITVVREGSKDYAYRVTVCSQRMATDLARFGVVPRKSKLANVPSAYLHDRDYWRGVVDGDGYIRATRYPTLELVGTRAVCASFAEFVEDLIGKRYSVKAHKSIYRCAVTGRDSVAKLCEALYGTSPVNFRLERKYNRAMKIIAASRDEMELRSAGLDARGKVYISAWAKL